jgi:hypothetical protein
MRQFLKKSIDIFTPITEIINKYPNYEWISVGSGYGETERYIELLGAKFIALCDPNPKSCLSNNPKPHRCLMPTHKNINDFLQNINYYNPNNKILLLDWPDNINLNNKYDIDAINTLHSKFIIIRYSETGHAGSKFLLDWIDNIDYKKYNILYKNQKKYILSNEYTIQNVIVIERI